MEQRLWAVSLGFAPGTQTHVFICRLAFCTGLFAGLTLGFLSMDKIDLEIVMEAGDPESRRCAKVSQTMPVCKERRGVSAASDRQGVGTNHHQLLIEIQPPFTIPQKIAPVRADGNLLLCSLLFGNVAVNVLISIIMSDLTSGLVGFFASTILIVIVGDIIPQVASQPHTRTNNIDPSTRIHTPFTVPTAQAICSRYALQVGSRTVCIVRLIEGLLYPIAKPMALLLDMALGEDIGTIRTVSELSKLLDIHVKHGAVDTEACSILTGALNYGNITVGVPA